MRTIAFLSQKGGSGKTTLAVHTAVAAQEAKERVVVIDSDPQRSATTWSEARKGAAPVVVTVSALDLEKVLAAARHDRMTLAIVDTAPHTAPDAARVARLADLVVIPVRPSAFDIAAVGATVTMLTAVSARGCFVISAAPPRSPEIVDTRRILEDYGLPVYGGEITDRRAFARAVASGRAVTEFDAEGKAAAEIRSLWKWIKGRTK
jgi:chromosome partitioning protein